MSNVREPSYSIGRGCLSFILDSWRGQVCFSSGSGDTNSFWWFQRDFCSVSCFHFSTVTGFTWQPIGISGISPSVVIIKMALCYVYALCVWISLLPHSLGTGFVYRFPGITLQRQRIHSEQSSSTGSTGAGSSTRCAESRLRVLRITASFPYL